MTAEEINSIRKIILNKINTYFNENKTPKMVHDALKYLIAEGLYSTNKALNASISEFELSRLIKGAYIERTKKMLSDIDAIIAETEDQYNECPNCGIHFKDTGVKVEGVPDTDGTILANVHYYECPLCNEKAYVTDENGDVMFFEYEPPATENETPDAKPGDNDLDFKIIDETPAPAECNAEEDLSLISIIKPDESITTEENKEFVETVEHVEIKDDSVLAENIKSVDKPKTTRKKKSASKKKSSDVETASKKKTEKKPTTKKKTAKKETK